MKKINITGKFYVLALPDEESCHDNYYKFWLFHKEYGVAIYMFSCKAETENEITALACNNALTYFGYLIELAEKREKYE